MNNSSSERGLEVRIEVNSDGKITIHGISVLEELWEDYHFFRQQALETSPQENLILYKRYVRAALLALFNYLEGVLNKWVMELDQSVDLYYMSIGSKIRLIREIVRRKIENVSIEWLEINETKKLRDAISHLKPSDDQFVMFEGLTSEAFFRDADRIIKWVETTKEILGLETHPNMGKIVSDVANEIGLITD